MILQSCFRRGVSKTINLLNYAVKNGFHLSSNVFEEAKGDGENVRERLFIPVQIEKPRPPRKVTIVGGSSRVGVGTCLNLILNDICDELVLTGSLERKDKLCGEGLDIAQSLSPWPHPKIKISFSYEETANSDLLIICSGLPRQPGKSRLDVAQGNIDYFKKIIPNLVKLSPDCVMIIVSNPVDIMTYCAWKYSCLDKNRVLGTGTDLDSARFRYYIAKRLGISTRSTKGWIIGEHGDSAVPIWSSVNVAGTRLQEIDPSVGTASDPNCWFEVFEQTKKAGNDLNTLKGASTWGISIATVRIARSVLKDAKQVHAVSIVAKGMYDLKTSTCLSLPVVIGNRGVHEVVQQVLTDEEICSFHRSANILHESMEKLKL